MVEWVKTQKSYSARRACRLLGLSRTASAYQAKQHEEDGVIQQQLQQLAEDHARWGFGLMFCYLKKQGYAWNHKRVHRVYRHLGLNLRVKAKKRFPKRTSLPLSQPHNPNDFWSMDFMSDSLANGRCFRIFHVIDEFNRESLSSEIDFSLPAERVVRVLEQVAEWRGYPKFLRVDNGPEFISKRLHSWAASHDITIHHIQPGKPAQNAYIERFNRTFREDVLDAYSFDNLEEARSITESWMTMYNGKRPHSSLQNHTPWEFLAAYA